MYSLSLWLLLSVREEFLTIALSSQFMSLFLMNIKTCLIHQSVISLYYIADIKTCINSKIEEFLWMDHTEN